MILRRWLASLRTRRRGAAAERELDDELRDHLEMAIEENLDRGMNEREATRAARRALGVSTSIKEARRQADSLYWFDTLRQDLRYGGRSLRRSPGFTVAVTLILGLGVAMTTTVFAIVDSLLLNAVPFAESHRLVELNQFGSYGGGPRQPVAMVEGWRNETALFDRVETYDRVEYVFTGDGEPETMPGARISPGLLPLLGIAPELGRAFAPNEAGGAAGIISHATWRSRFGGDPSVVGRPLRFRDRALTVIGVMPASFRFPDAHVAFWEPFDAGRATPERGRPPVVSVLARLAPGLSFEQADARAAVLAPQWNPEWAATGVTTRLGSLNQLAGLGIYGNFAYVRQVTGRAVPPVRRRRLPAPDRLCERREPVPVGGRCVAHPRVRDPRGGRSEPAQAVPSVADGIGGGGRPCGTGRVGAHGVAGRTGRRHGVAEHRPGDAEPYRRGRPSCLLGDAGRAVRWRRGVSRAGRCARPAAISCGPSRDTGCRPPPVMAGCGVCSSPFRTPWPWPC